VLAASGCGSDSEGRSGRLVWEKTPRVLVPETLPGDRVLRGEVKNDSLRKVSLEAADLRLLDADGRRIESSATFIAGYSHPLYPFNRGPATVPESERRRLGRAAEIESGKSVPLTMSWHEPRGDREAVRIDYGAGSLPVPSRRGD
jgi:hypothetical protein